MRGWSVAVAVLSTALTACACRASSGTLRAELVLGQVDAAPGQRIEGVLIITNPGAPFNLTAVARPFNASHLRYHCRPAFEVYLTDGTLTNAGGFRADCSSRSFVVGHGANRLTFRVLTSYASCAESPDSTGTAESPPCGSSGSPPLPVGSYRATIAWSEWVPIPRPRPVAVRLVYSCGATPCTPDTNPG